jgi:hypothetical protein
MTVSLARTAAILAAFGVLLIAFVVAPLAVLAVVALGLLAAERARRRQRG